MSKNLKEFIQRVTITQALLSACGIVLLFGICRLFFSLGYSFAVCLPAVLAPHLIAMDYYLLTESLFTFNSLLGIFFFLLAAKLQKNWLYLIAGFFFGYLVLIKPAAILFGPFLAVTSALFFLRVKTPRELIVMVILVIAGYTAVYSPYLVIRNNGTEKFAVSGQTIRDKIIMGADINLQHFMTSKRTPEFKSKMAKVNSDFVYAIQVLKEKVSSDLAGHLKWYLGGKIIYYWRWDNFYNGDVYQYPMQRKGFDENVLLKGIHKVMKVLHWPIFVLTLMGIVAVFIRPFVLKKNLDEDYLVVVPALVFLYFAVLFTILIPLPRYSIPVRPFSYILAVYAIKVLIETSLSFKKTPHPTLQA
ncbi:hypothetical protein ACFLZ5_02575 [Thermodesulfobacteriota bacterium]